MVKNIFWQKGQGGKRFGVEIVKRGEKVEMAESGQ